MRRLILAAIATTLFLLPHSARAQIVPTITFVPDPLVFPDTRAGRTSSPLDLTILNNSARLSLYVFSMKLADNQNFGIVSDGCSGKLTPPSGSCIVQIQFAPNATGNFITSLSVISLSRQIIDTVGVTGTGVAPAVTLTPLSIDFGHHTVGQPSEIRTATLLNSGSEALTISDISTVAPFGVTDDCTTTLAPQTSCNFFITFAPSATGSFSGAVTITDDAPGSPHAIALAGTGIVPGNADIGLSTASVDFGTQLVGTTSAAMTIAVTSNGTADLAIDSIVASQNFAVSHDCPATMPPSSQCTISATFTPPATEAVSGTLTINDNATDSPQTVSLAGQGITQGAPQADLSANELDFGDQIIDQPSQAKTVTITNKGSENLAISSIAVLGDGATAFSERNGCTGVSLAPNASCTVDVTFTPPVEDQFVASLSITDNASDSPQSVVLTGAGIQGGGGGGGCSLIAARTPPFARTKITSWRD